MLIHSSVIHICIYFPYFLSYFILLPKVTCMETEIFWAFLFKVFCSSYVSFLLKLKLFGYPSWIGSETRAFLTNNCPTKDMTAWLWQRHLQRRSSVLGNNINPYTSLAFTANVWGLRAQWTLEIQENFSNQFQQIGTYWAVQTALGVLCFCSLWLQLERGQSNVQSVRDMGERRERERICVYI